MAFPETKVNPTIYQIIRMAFDLTLRVIKAANPFTTITNTRPTVTTTSSIILAANTSRKSAMIFNQSGGVVYLKLGATAVANEGIRLANNDFYEITATNLFTGAIHAIRGAGSSTIEVMEGT